MSTETTLDDCGCCEPVDTDTTHENPPEQSALRYRTGAQPAILARMKRRIAQVELPDGAWSGTRPLLGLTTRSTRDPSIALLDAWACVCDVLSFYQERIANEGYIGTATERRSLIELAWALAYVPRPGVAAGTWLAFTVDEAAGAPGFVRIDVGLPVMSVPAQDQLPQTYETTETMTCYAAWNALTPPLTRTQTVDSGGTSGATTLTLSGTGYALRAGDLVLLVSIATTSGVPDWTASRPLTAVSVYAAAGTTVLTWATPLSEAGEGVSLSATAVTVWVLRKSSALFGANSPEFAMLPADVRTHYITADGTEWPAITSFNTATAHATLTLDRVADTLLADTWILVRGENSTGTVEEVFKAASVRTVGVFPSGTSGAISNAYGTSGRGTQITLGSGTTTFTLYLRSATVYYQAEALTLADEAWDDDITGSSIELDVLDADLPAERPYAITGTDATTGESYSDIVTVERIGTSADGAHTVLTLNPTLSASLTRSTVRLNANVLAATHGESVTREVLGSGDATRTNQTFALKKNPMTWVSAATATGAEATLTVTVNDVAWSRIEALYGVDGNERCYIVRTDDDGKTWVTFGDGVTGARLPTGTENVKAIYRSGLGTSGEVDAGKLILPKKKPLGLRSVVNPVESSGSEDAEVFDDLRVNAPLTVLTLDRVVSLSDYEDYTAAFSGVGKARAARLWDGRANVVHLSVADSEGDPLDGDSTLALNLSEALDTGRDMAGPRLVLQGYTEALFQMWVAVLVEGTYDADDVLAAVATALETAYAFTYSTFGGSVSVSGIASVAHSVAGVTAVDVRVLRTVADATEAAALAADAASGSTTATTSDKLQAALASVAIPSGRRVARDEDFVAAELLILEPTHGVIVTEVAS